MEKLTIRKGTVQSFMFLGCICYTYQWSNGKFGGNIDGTADATAFETRKEAVENVQVFAASLPSVRYRGWGSPLFYTSLNPEVSADWEGFVKEVGQLHTILDDGDCGLHSPTTTVVREGSVITVMHDHGNEWSYGSIKLGLLEQGDLVVMEVSNRNEPFFVVEQGDILTFVDALKEVQAEAISQERYNESRLEVEQDWACEDALSEEVENCRIGSVASLNAKRSASVGYWT